MNYNMQGCLHNSGVAYFITIVNNIKKVIYSCLSLVQSESILILKGNTQN